TRTPPPGRGIRHGRAAPPTETGRVAAAAAAGVGNHHDRPPHGVPPRSVPDHSGFLPWGGTGSRTTAHPLPAPAEKPLAPRNTEWWTPDDPTPAAAADQDRQDRRRQPGRHHGRVVRLLPLRTTG